ncbi:MAG TPA: hypothetical protein VMJ73_04165 [Rhizomicrobium sp.]|nr:hypothetical protein [Rhizomicrobium sp.]
MRRAVLLAVLSLSVAGLSGCGRNDDTPRVVTKTESNGTQSVTVTDNKGATVTVAGAGASANMPAYAPLYPGASVETTVTAPGKGGMVAFKTSAAPDAVIAFYKKSVSGAGFKDTLNMTSGDTMTYSATDEKGVHALNVVASKGDDGTQVQVTWN